jgi:hypothetical protein
MIKLVIQNALVASGVVLFFLLLRSKANRPPTRDPQTGELVLQLSTVLVWTMGLISVGGPLAMAALSFVIPFQHESQVFIPIGLGLFFLVLGGLLWLWASRRRTRVGERGLTSEYVFAQPRFLPWDEIDRISFSNGQELWLYGTSRKKAMLHVWFVGVKEAVPLLREHLPRKVIEKQKAVLDKFAMATGVEGISGGAGAQRPM